MTLAHAAGRACDLFQLVAGRALCRPSFRALRRRRPDLVHRMRHEPFAARGDAFVQSVGWLEKLGFVSKMLGTDGGWVTRRAGPREGARDAFARPHEDGPGEVIFAGDLLYPGVLGASSLAPSLARRLARASCVVVNLEATLGPRPHEIAPWLTPRGLRQLIEYERNPTDAEWASRIDVASLVALLGHARRAIVSVANNHTLDDGPLGFARTVDQARAAGIAVVGDARAEDGAHIVEVGQYRLGLFAMAYGSNRPDGAEAYHLRFNGVPYRVRLDRIAAITADLRRRGATHVVALLHWGYEHEHEPAPEQARCANQLFETGVSAIIGHHPHLLQRSEPRAGRWVSYSLGDFVGGDRTIWSRFGAMVSLRLAPHGAVRGEVVPIVQSPFWSAHQTMLLEDAPLLERAVFARWFAGKLPAREAE